MNRKDAQTFLDWLKRGTDLWRMGKHPVPTHAETIAWAAVMDAKHEADDHGSVKAFCEKFLARPKQGELM